MPPAGCPVRSAIGLSAFADQVGRTGGARCGINRRSTPTLDVSDSGVEIGLTDDRPTLLAGVRWLVRDRGSELDPRAPQVRYGLAAALRLGGLSQRPANLIERSDLVRDLEADCQAELYRPGRPSERNAFEMEASSVAIGSSGFDSPVFGGCRLPDRSWRIRQARSARCEEATH